MGNRSISGQTAPVKLSTRGKIIEFFGGVPAERFQADRVANYINYGDGFALPYDGEKNLGQVGPIISYWMDFPRLRARSWQSYAESEITRAIVNRFIMWVVGSGLRLQSTPESDLLKAEGISIDRQQFSVEVERRFKLFLGSKKSTINKKQSIDALGSDVLKNALVGGDVLIRMYWKDGGVRVQMIDGQHIQSPISTLGNAPNFLDNGNELRYGIETDTEGKIVRFHVRKRDYSYEQIEAYDPITGLETAFLVKGNTYRPDDVRGIPLISVVLEKLAKLDRYSEAAVGSAEERAKVPFWIEHSQFSDGENPFIKQVAAAFQGGPIPGGNADGKMPQTIEGEQLADKVIATSEKTTYNMPIGATIKAMDMKNDMFFKDFFTANIDTICACLGIPPDVAFSKYENSYSSSRAALKDWEHTLKVSRDLLAEQFYKKIYEFWFTCQVLNKKISAPGYTQAIMSRDEIIVDAYTQSRFVGDNVPHIDPLKEVQAERLKLGDRGVNIPLTTVEEATQAVNSGDSVSNIAQFAEELSNSESLGIKTEVIPVAVPADKGE